MKNLAALSILAVALIWTSVILALTWVLGGTPYAWPALMYVGGGVAGTLVVVGGTLRRLG